jgi:hypothetical protein
MTSIHRKFRALRAAEGVRRTPVRSHGRVAVAAAFGSFWLIAILAIAPSPPSPEYQLATYIDKHAQSLEVVTDPAVEPVARDVYSSTPGIETLAASGTNHDWAKMVMLFGGWPQSESNITVMLRWMRQENGPPSWFLRNNPLNNGYGSGGGGGLGRYANLVVAAQKAAENLQRHPGFQSIEDGFANSSPTEVIEAAIWASPWASGHYANGSHWHYTDVEIVKAPAGSWG